MTLLSITAAQRGPWTLIENLVETSPTGEVCVVTYNRATVRAFSEEFWS
ncbi:hypothetical protein MSTE_01966 [Mycobacteroides stephanolepidis]|uniref:Uncharacterized protein n=1 Tax=[Mycobacterium] stephanolepidis TaxID=1520670 RepID=A0A1Z4EWE8_9MYCO|nr:hypothetical protein MSTE_01966 [[Mycobacterium] stephanolepidis]